MILGDRVFDIYHLIIDYELKYDMPRKYIDTFVRDITGSFAPGDKVFVLDNRARRVSCDKSIDMILCDLPRNILQSVCGAKMDEVEHETD